jgi:hypothetical protein
MSNNDDIRERLARIEAHVEYIKENMANKATVAIIKWCMGGIASLALTALIMAAKK